MNAAEFQALRVAAGLTRAQMAQELGVDRTTVYRYETGARKRIPSDVADQLRAIASRKEQQP